MDNETKYILNDLTDIVDALSDIVREMNPGADFRFIDFVADRVNRALLAEAVTNGHQP